MFFKSKNMKKSDSKCDLMEEKRRDSIELESLDLVVPRKRCPKWHILNVIILVTILALAAWTMIYKQYRLTALSSSKIEDEIFKTTMRVISETEVVLKEVRQQADILCEKNKQAALQYVTEIRDTMKDRTKIGVEKVNKVVEENLSSIREELLALDTTTKDIFNGLVNIFQSDINETINTLSSSEEKNLTYALDNAISQAEYEVNSMWNDMDQMYSYYTSYSTELIEKKAQNITERINGLVASQRRYCDCTLYDRVSMCYNISSANIETSRTIEKLVHAINNLFNNTDVVDKLHFMHSDADEHALAVINDSTSLLDKYKQTSQEMLETLISDHYCFLGSAVRQTAENTYPHIKRFILRSWRSAIQNASVGLNSTLTVDPLIKAEYRHRIIDDAKESLQKLGNLIKSKASLLQDEATKNRFIEKADFVELGYVMEDRFKNVTEVINTEYTKNLWITAEMMKYNVEFIVDQKIPFVSSLSIQNYLPTDVCPLAMDFSNFVYRLLRTDLFKDSGNDVLDGLLPEHGDAVYVTGGTQTDDDTSAQDSDIQISIVLIGDGSSENEEKPINVAEETTDTRLVDYNGSPSVAGTKPFLGSESTAAGNQNKVIEPLKFNVEPKPDGYVEEKPKDDFLKTESIATDMNLNAPFDVKVSKVRAEAKLPDSGKLLEESQKDKSKKLGGIVGVGEDSTQIITPKMTPVPIEPMVKSISTMNDKPFGVTVSPQEMPSQKIQGLSEGKKRDSTKVSEVTSTKMQKLIDVEKTTQESSRQKSAASFEQDDVSVHSSLTDDVDSVTYNEESDKKLQKKFVNAVNKVRKIVDAVDSMSGRIDKR